MIELIVGREEGKEQPRLAVTSGGKTSYFGEPGSVPKEVSRKHCRILLEDDLSSMSITDITDNNFMYVNGQECKSKGHLTLDCTVELSPVRYSLDLAAILRVFTSGQAFHIAHLYHIYQGYHQGKIDYQVKQNRFNALSAIPGVLSMSSIGLSFAMNDQTIRMVMIIIAGLFGIVFAIIRIMNAGKGPNFLRAMDERFHDEYVCPNPLCGRFLGSWQYKDLIKGKACPFCKSKYIE